MSKRHPRHDEHEFDLGETRESDAPAERDRSGRMDSDQERSRDDLAERWRQRQQQQPMKKK